MAPKKTNNKITSAKLVDMSKGWFIGNFNPTLYKTEDVEVAVKHYKAGESEKYHFHKIATEFTVVVSGEIKMDGKIYKSGDIVIVPSEVSTDFHALTDVITTVVKIPGASNDKFYSNGAEGGI